jgi:hypothetical protein
MSAHGWTPVGVRCRSRMASEPPCGRQPNG